MNISNSLPRPVQPALLNSVLILSVQSVYVWMMTVQTLWVLMTSLGLDTIKAIFILQTCPPVVVMVLWSPD